MKFNILIKFGKDWVTKMASRLYSIHNQMIKADSRQIVTRIAHHEHAYGKLIKEQLPLLKMNTLF